MMGVGDFDLTSLNGKYVVLGLTAPGLAMFKGTALSPITDDNLIIATSLDDLLSDTGLTNASLLVSSAHLNWHVLDVHILLSERG